MEGRWAAEVQAGRRARDQGERDSPRKKSRPIPPAARHHAGRNRAPPPPRRDGRPRVACRAAWRDPGPHL